MEPIIAITLVLAPIVIAVVFGVAIVGALSTVMTVAPYNVAVAFVKGQARVLETGRYRFWTKDVQIQYVDPRDLWIQVSGQELLTSDGAPVRVSVSALRSVVDVSKFASLGDSYTAIYAFIQLAVREEVLTRTMEQLIADRAVIDAALLERVEADVAPLGMRIDRIAVRDLTLIGDTKRAYSEVIQAQLQAKAALERARGEAAAMRSLLNTAELVRKNPELLQLRALQQFASGSHQVELHLGVGDKPSTS